MSKTQDLITIEEIKDNLIFLKDGGVSLVLTTSAVNFGLLFETEQIAIIENFAGLLNSLSFPIQIVIISQRLDVTSYLKTLDAALAKQTNPLLISMTAHYRLFVENLIKEKEVLDKQFYICLHLSSLEIGLVHQSIADRSKKALSVLTPRREHIIRQLNRLGLKARQLNNLELIKLFYNLYNPVNSAPVVPLPQAIFTVPKAESAPQPTTPVIARSFPVTRFVSPPQTRPVPAANPSLTSIASPLTTAKLAPPFVVEELPDDMAF